ncbi:MAG TPA: hypothetical protein VF688_12365 [Allosphingosinicella sp.]|jgi:hypothetical protein
MNAVLANLERRRSWIPAFAGMTIRAGRLALPRRPDLHPTEQQRSLLFYLLDTRTHHEHDGVSVSYRI